MAEFMFNKDYRDRELKRVVKANEPVEMTVKRADEVVKNIADQKVKGYEKFNYERLDKEKQKEEGK